MDLTSGRRVRVIREQSSQFGQNSAGEGSTLSMGQLFGSTVFRCETERRAQEDCDVILTQSVYLRVMEHLCADTTREHGGLLLGSEIQANKGSVPAVLITHCLPARQSHGTPTSLTFTEETWAEFDRLTDLLAQQGLRLRRLGWYHSHPNIAIFLSNWDLDVCTLFDRPSHVALVVDPIGVKGGFFVRGEAGYRADCPQGFIELHDVSTESVVQWKNVRRVVEQRVKGRPSAESNTSTPLRIGGHDIEGGVRSTEISLSSVKVAQTKEPAGPQSRATATPVEPKASAVSRGWPPEIYAIGLTLAIVAVIALSANSSRVSQEALSRLQTCEDHLRDVTRRVKTIEEKLETSVAAGSEIQDLAQGQRRREARTTARSGEVSSKPSKHVTTGTLDEPNTVATTGRLSAKPHSSKQSNSAVGNKEEPKVTEVPKTEPPKTEAPKTQPPKTEPPKTEPPKTEPPKTEPPKIEAPKAEPLKTEPVTKPNAIKKNSDGLDLPGKNQAGKASAKQL